MLRAAIVALGLLFSGCAVMFISPYDEQTDNDANALVRDTEVFLSNYALLHDAGTSVIQKGKPYDSGAAKFYNDARGAIKAMLVRSEQKARNDEEIGILRQLVQQYNLLEASHKLGTISDVSASGLRRSLRALIHVQLAKKHLEAASPKSAEFSLKIPYRPAFA